MNTGHRLGRRGSRKRQRNDELRKFYFSLNIVIMLIELCMNADMHEACRTPKKIKQSTVKPVKLTTFIS
jgi:hypothetical protein